MFRVLTSMLQSSSSVLDHTPLPVAVWWVPSSEVRAAGFQFFPFKMMMTWPPFRINLHELNNTSTLWVFVEGSESSKAKRKWKLSALLFRSNTSINHLHCPVCFCFWDYTIWHLCSVPGSGASVIRVLWHVAWFLNLLNVCVSAPLWTDNLNKNWLILQTLTGFAGLCLSPNPVSYAQTLTLSQTNAWSALSQVTVIVYSRGTTVREPTQTSWIYVLPEATVVVQLCG